MKKLLLMAAVAVFGLSNVNAQDENTSGGFSKGDVYISGTLGFNTVKQGDFKANDFSISPAVGYFVTENIALEAIVSYGSADTTLDFEGDSFDVKNNSFGGGLGATYFFTPTSQFSFTVGAGVSYMSTTSEFDVIEAEDIKTNSFAVVIAPGLNYFVSDAFALRASIGALSYSSSEIDFEGFDAVNSFGLNLNLSNVNFGVTYKF